MRRFLFVLFDTSADNLFRLSQPAKQIAGSAAQIEHRRARFDERTDHPKIKTDWFRRRRYHREILKRGG